jgi:hypothetical protein
MASRWTASLKGRNLKLFLGTPLLLVSLALHGLVLSLPMPGQQDSAEEISDPGDPQAPPDAIQVSRLPALPNQPAPPPPEASTQAAPAQPAAARPAPTAARPAAPVKAQPQTAAPAAVDPDEQAAVDPPAPSELAPLPVEVPPPTLAERLLDPAAYRANNLARAAEEGTSDFLNWYVALSSQGDGPAPGMGTRNLEPLRIPYPLQTCLTPAPVEGRLGVIVNADGTAHREPEILSSTGYDVLDDQAKAVISNYPFPAEGALMAYGLPVVVEYDAATCVPPS